MAGRGPAPKENSVTRNARPRGDVQVASSTGWSHGKIPAAPKGLMPESRAAWKTWFEAWFASFWTPSDLPGLRQVIRLYDQVERGEFQRSAELRLQMDTYGITPKGQQDRRWRPPVEPTQPAPSPSGSTYGHLRAV